jgi:cytoskeletal protein CcmA (bactofilin family)
MALILAVTGVMALFLVWAALPLLPSLLEWHRRTDDKPLRVVRGADVDIRHFANAFRTWITGHVGEALAMCGAGGAAVEGSLEDGTRYVVLPDGDAPRLDIPPAGPVTCPAVTVGAGRLELPERALFPLEIFGGGDVEVGDGTVCRAILSDGDLRLGRGCWSLRWLHARGTLRARESCALHGRASAERELRLEPGCRFERLNAPRVSFGEPLPADAPGPLTPWEAKDVPDLVEDAAGRWLVRRRLEVPAHRRIESDIVVTGELVIGEGTRIVGSLKGHGDVRLGAGVVVEGAVVSWRDLAIGPGCRIHGPLVAERDARIGAGAVVGSAAVPSTVTARCLEVEAGAAVHGTVWAHGGGVVLPATPQGRS